MTVGELVSALKSFPDDVEVVTVFDGFAPGFPSAVALTTYAERFPGVDDSDDVIVVFD